MSPSNRPAWSMPATGGQRACAWGRSGGGGTGWGRYEFGAQLIVMLLLLLGANCAMAAAADPTGSLYFLRLDALDFDIQAALPDELSVYEGHQTQSAPEDPSYGPLHFDPVAERVATDIHPFPVDATSSPLTPLYAQDRDDAAGSELSVWEERLVLDPHSVELHYHIDGRLAGQVDAGADTDAPLFVSPMQLMDEIQLVIDGIYWPGLSNPPGPDQDLALVTIRVRFADGTTRDLAPHSTLIEPPDDLFRGYTVSVTLAPADLEDADLGAAFGLDLVLRTPASGASLSVPALPGPALAGLVLGLALVHSALPPRRRRRGDHRCET